MKAPQIIIITICALNIGLELAQHGKPRTGNHNALFQLVSTVITIGLLTWGGFFSG